MPTNINQLLGIAAAAGAVWYAFTGNTMALKTFVGITGGKMLLDGFGG